MISLPLTPERAGELARQLDQARTVLEQATARAREHAHADGADGSARDARTVTRRELAAAAARERRVMAQYAARSSVLEALESLVTDDETAAVVAGVAQLVDAGLFVNGADVSL